MNWLSDLEIAGLWETDADCTYRVAFSSLGSQTASLHVQLAVVGRGDEVDQVDVAVRLEPVELGQQHAPAVLALLLHLVCPVKLLLQHGADLQKETMN